jgi:hypothetical protein
MYSIHLFYSGNKTNKNKQPQKRVINYIRTLNNGFHKRLVINIRLTGMRFIQALNAVAAISYAQTVFAIPIRYADENILPAKPSGMTTPGYLCY